MKLKQLLKETKVWERKFGESLPTLEDTTKAYKLKLEQEQFKAKSKETGRVVVYKSKDAMDKAIKGGTAEPLDKKTSDKSDSGKPEKVKGADLFKKDKPKSDKPKSLFSQVSDENKDEFMDVVSDIDSNSGLDTIKTDRLSGGSNVYVNNVAIPALKEKFPGGGDEAYEGLNGGIDSAIESLEYIEDKKLKKQLENELYQISNDMEEELGEKYQDAADGVGKLGYTKLFPYMTRLQDFKDNYLSKPGKDVEVGTKIKDSKPKTPTFVNDDGDVVANDFDSALELAGNLGMSEEELEYIEKEKDSEALGDYLDGHGYSQKDKPEEKESEWSEEDEEGYITNLKTGEREYVRENKMKLKSLLKETKVWERKFGEPLPTFSGVMEKHSGKKIDEQGALSRRAGINVFGDRKLQLMTKNLRQTAFDLEKVAKKKDEQAFDDILQRITITIGVMRSFLNKPKRSM